MPTAAPLPPLPEKYRATLFACLGVLTSTLIAWAGFIETGEPLGGVGWATILVTILTALGVYWPGNPWTKFTAALAGVIAQPLISAMNGGLTTGEMVTILAMAAGAIGVVSFPNPIKVVDGKVVSTDRRDADDLIPVSPLP